MGEHKYGVPERAKRRKQKRILHACLAVCIIIAIVGFAMLINRNSSVDGLDLLETNPTTATDATDVIEPAEPNPILHVGTVDSEGNELLLDEAVEQNTFKVGDILTIGGTKMVYMSAGEFDADDCDDGYKCVYLQFAVENVGEDLISVSMSNFASFVGSGATLNYGNVYFGGTDYLEVTQLSPNRYVEGYIYYQVPTDVDEIEVHYQTNPGNTDSQIVKFVYSNEDSGYNGNQEWYATEGALKVGDVESFGDITVAYKSCVEYISSDVDVQPKDGYRFVAIELEVTNNNEIQKMSASSWDFKCYADDMECSVIHTFDGNLNAVVAESSTVAGYVTFEVPVNAEIIEAEYMYDYATGAKVYISIETD